MKKQYVRPSMQVAYTEIEVPIADSPRYNVDSKKEGDVEDDWDSSDWGLND